MKDVRDSKLLNVLVPCGIVLILFCLLFSISNSTGRALEILSIIFVIVQFILGILIIIFSIKWTHRATQLFVGMLLLSWGLMFVLISKVFPITIKECWPLYGTIAGILLFVSGFYKYQKMKFGYCIPALTLIGMSIWYSFFSFKIIKKSFLTVASNIGPLFMLLIAVLLVVLFLLQQKHKKLVFPDDEPGTFSDEDDGIMTPED